MNWKPCIFVHLVLHPKPKIFKKEIKPKFSNSVQKAMSLEQQCLWTKFFIYLIVSLSSLYITLATNANSTNVYRTNLRKEKVRDKPLRSSLLKRKKIMVYLNIFITLL